jgi:hypothetical protein
MKLVQTHAVCGIVVQNRTDDQKRWKLARADWASFQDLCFSSFNPTALLRSKNKFKLFTEKLIQVAGNPMPEPVVNVGLTPNRAPGSMKSANQ